MKFVLIDRYPVLRLGLSEWLSGHFSNLKTIECSCTAELKAHPSTPDVVLIILALNQSLELNDIDEIKGALAWCPTAKVVGYQERANPYIMEPYLNAGLSGYYSKQEDVEKFAVYINNILIGTSVTNLNRPATVVHST